jgi:hypothetical protein
MSKVLTWATLRIDLCTLNSEQIIFKNSCLLSSFSAMIGKKNMAAYIKQKIASKNVNQVVLTQHC